MRTLLIVLLASCLASARSVVPASDQRATQDVLERLRATRDPGFSGVAGYVDELALRAGVVAELAFDVLQQKRVPAVYESDEAQALSIVQREIILCVLERGAAKQARECALAWRLADGPESLEASLWLIGAGGQPSDVALIEKWAQSALEAEHLELDGVEEALRWSWCRIAQRDPAAFQSLESVCTRNDPAIVNIALQAIGDSGDVRGLDCLLTQLNADSPSSALALGQVRRLSRPVSHGQRLELVDAAYVLSAHAGALGDEALRVLGGLQATGATSLLLESLDSSRSGRVGAARWALAEMSGYARDTEPQRWHDWYARESAAFALAAELRSALASTNAAVQSKAVREIGRRRLYGIEWSRMLVDTQPVNDAIRIQICEALAALRSPEALPFLMVIMAQPDAPNRPAAHAALCAITGLDLPQATSVWTSRLAL